MGKKCVALVLSACILFSVLPVQVLAADITSEEMEPSISEEQAVSAEESANEGQPEPESDAAEAADIAKTPDAESEPTQSPEDEPEEVAEPEPTEEDDSTQETPTQYATGEEPTDEAFAEPEPSEQDETLPVQTELPPEEELQEEPEEAREEESVSDEAMMANLTSLPSKIDLYVISDSYADSLTLPEGYPSSYQCNVSNAKYERLDGYSVEVSSDGTITPAYDVMYWSGGYGHTWSTGAEGETTTREYHFGISTLRVTSGSETCTIKVQVHDYAQEYACQVMDTYYAQRIRSDMSELEKLDVIAAFPAQYNYSVEYSGYVGLIVKGGGDCWASASAVQYLCQKAGFQSHIRYGANDGGAGSGHRNVAVQVGGQIYVVESGYVGSAPRYYNVIPENTGFFYRVENGGAKILQYDGFQPDIVVPERIDGYPVTAIGELAFYYGERYSKSPVRSITLPHSLERLEDFSLESLNSLTEITIPENVSYIGRLPFADCPNLTAINVDSRNQCFQSQDGVLFDKSMETLIAYPTNGQKKYVVPEGVKTISEYAFAYSRSRGVTALLLPSTLETVGEGAFGDTALKQIYFKGKRPTIGDFALHGLCVAVNYPSGDTSWNGIEDLGSNPYSADQVVWKTWNIQNTIPVQTLANSSVSVSSQTYSGSAIKPAVKVVLDGRTLVEGTDYTVSYSDNINAGTATMTITGKGNYTGTINKSFTITAISIDKAEITGITNQTYTGSALTPAPTVKVNGKTLSSKTDYTVVYSDNTNIGIATITVIGKGNYTGRSSTRFTITTSSQPGSALPTQPQKLSGTLSYSKTYGDPSFRMNITGLGNAKIHYRTESDSNVSVTDDGTVTIHDVGDAEIIASSEPTEQYYPASVVIAVSVLPKNIGKCRMVFNRVGDIPSDTDDFAPYLTLIDGDTVLAPWEYWFDGASWGDEDGHLEYLDYTVIGVGRYTGIHEFHLTPISQTPVLKSAVLSGSKVKLTWQQEPGALGCLIYRKIGSGGYTLVKTISNASTTTWTDTLPSGCSEAVSYQIKFYTMKGNSRVVSGASAAKTIYWLENPIIEKVENVNGGLKLTWGKVEGAVKYRVYYKTGSSGWSRLGDTTATAYTWKGEIRHKIHFYRPLHFL